MHELAITQGIFDTVSKELASMGVIKVNTIYVKVGEFYDYVPEIIQEYFDVISEGSRLEGAIISVENIPTTVECLDCGHSGAIVKISNRCPKCLGRNIRFLTGKEFYIDKIEIEEE